MKVKILIKVKISKVSKVKMSKSNIIKNEL